MLSRVLSFIIFVFTSPMLIIINGYNGYLVEPKNIDQLAKKITLLIKNKTLCEKSRTKR